MALFVIVLGALLSLGGAAYVVLGFDIVMTERGSAMTIGGVVALSGGIVTLAIGLAILRLSQILRVLEANQAARPSEAAQAPADGPPAARPAAEQSPKAVLAGAAAAATLAAGTSALASDKGPPQPGGGEAAAAAAASQEQREDADLLDELDRMLAPREDAPAPQPEADVAALLTEDAREPPAEAAAPPANGDLNFLLEEEPAPHDTNTAADAGAGEDVPGPTFADAGSADAGSAGAEPSPEADPDMGPAIPTEVAPPPSGKTVLGSYNAGGRVYTMYSDGSVEALTENGVELFESMDALREHLART